MSDMDGNEQFDTAYFAAERVQSGLSDITDATVANAYATLALAYEQRTANLIAAGHGRDMRLLLDLTDGELQAIRQQLRARLGLEQP